MPHQQFAKPGFDALDTGYDFTDNAAPVANQNGDIFAVAAGPLPEGFSAVKEPETTTGKIRMLQDMVNALVEENGKKDEEILRLRAELERRK
jgi:hypothetical protein